MKKLGYFWVFTLTINIGTTPNDDDNVCYKIPVYNYIGSRNKHRAERACEERHERLATICEEIRSSGYVPEKIAVCTSGIYVTGKRKDNGRTKTVRV